jgi:acyl carrier protein
MNETTADQVRQIVADVFGLDPSEVSLDASTESIAEWDSLRHLDVLLSLEQRFGVQISPELAGELRSVRAIVEALARLRDSG